MLTGSDPGLLDRFTGKAKFAGYAAPGRLCQWLRVNPGAPGAGRRLVLGSGAQV